MKITACVIVKNEERNIKTWLDGVEPLAQEIIVVDTGSTDNTREIVQASRAKLYEFPWINDFSAAKNFALDKATGDWIIFLDADETFSVASIARIKDWLKRLHGQRKIVGIMCRLINIDVTDNNRYIGSTVQLRIFRNKSYLKYQGRIHEALTVPPKYSVELVNDIEIYHTGYSANLVKRKLARNLELLKEKIVSQRGEPTPKDYRYLMDCYYGLGKYEEALENAEKALANAELVADALPHLHIIKISCHIFGNFGFARTQQAFEAALAACPRMPDIMLMYGLYLHDQKHYLQSEAKLLDGMALYGQQHDMNVDSVADNSKRFLPAANWIMGNFSLWQGDLAKALEYYVQGLQIYRYHVGLLDSLLKTLQQTGSEEEDIIKLLNSLYEMPKDSEFIMKVVSPSRQRKVYLYYAGKAGRMDTVTAYQAAGRYDAAALLAYENYDWLCKCGIAAALVQNKPVHDTLSLLLSRDYKQLWEILARGSKSDRYKAIQRGAAIRRLQIEFGDG